MIFFTRLHPLWIAYRLPSSSRRRWRWKSWITRSVVIMVHNFYARENYWNHGQRPWSFFLLLLLLTWKCFLRGPAVLHHRAVRNAASETARPVKASKELYLLKRYKCHSTPVYLILDNYVPIRSIINIIPRIHKWLIVGVRLSPLLHRHHPPWWLHSSQRGKVRAAHDHHDHHGHNGRDHDHNGRDHDYNHNGKSCTSIEEWWNPKILSDLFSPPSWQLKAFVLFSGLSNIAF